MSKKANPTAVGLFVVIGMILLIAGIISFSSFKVKGVTQDFVLYFDSSVKGLSVGAPVTHRGVTIGKVKHMQLRFNQEDDDFDVPVFIELDQSLLRSQSDRKVDITDRELLEDLIAKGMRAIMEASSFVTGQLYIELSLLPNAPPPVFHQVKPLYLEIPTAPTKIESLMSNISSVDVKGLAERLTSVLEILEGKVEDADINGISEGLTGVLAAIEAKLEDPTLDEALETTKSTLEDFKDTSTVLRDEVVLVSDDIKAFLNQIESTMIEVREGVADLRHTLAADNVIAYQLSIALEQLAKASSSISELADFLILNPNALISGREHEASKK
jgi:paraquat-inducible protein B